MINNKYKIIYLILSLLIIVGCNNNSISKKELVSKEVFAMDTYMTVTAYGDSAQDAIDEAIKEIKRLDALLSTSNENSEIFLLNKNGSGEISEDTKKLLEYSLNIWNDTKGKFDITIYPIMQAWGFTDKSYAVPSDETLIQLLDLVDSSLINLNKNTSTVSFEKVGVKIDLGGIAKGYTSSKIMDIFREHNINRGLINLGGNVQVLGRKTNEDLWQVAIKDPDKNGYLGILQVEDCAVITSGGYERYFEQNGSTYHHIIDPMTGYPANSDLKSVTIVCTDGTLADGLSTSLFIMGKNQAIDYWEKHSDQFDMILVEENGMIYVTEDIVDHFTSDYKVEVVKNMIKD